MENVCFALLSRLRVRIVVAARGSFHRATQPEKDC